MPTETAELPSIDESIGAFMEGRAPEVESPEAPEAPEAAEPVTPVESKAADQKPSNTPAKDETESDDLDLSGGVKDKEATPPEEDYNKEEFEKYDRSLGGQKAKPLRLELFKAKKTVEKLQSQLEALKSKPNPDASVESIRAESDALKKKLSEIEASRDQLSKQLAKVDIANSPEFQQKYLEPWREAQQQAIDEIGQLTKVNEKNEEVPLTWDDFKPILQLPLKDALAKAKELLGDDYQLAMGHRRSILARQQEYAKALESHEAEAQNIVAERAKQTEAMKQLFESETTRLKTEFPDLYTTDAKNPRESEQAQKGAKLAKAALFGFEGLDPQARIKAAAIVAERAANFPVLAIRAAGYKAEIDRLTKELETLKNGLPGGGSGSSNGSSDLEESIADSMDRFKRGR